MGTSYDYEPTTTMNKYEEKFTATALIAEGYIRGLKEALTIINDHFKEIEY